MNPFVDLPSPLATVSPVIVALDFHDERSVLEFISRLEPGSCRLKVGKELFTATGPHLVQTLVARGFEVCLDLKFHDIPNTVASACKVAADLGVWMVDVHASGGRRMIEAAREALDTQSARPLLIAVTVLTSMDASDLAEIGLSDPAGQVSRLAALAQSSGADGVVCSAQEAPLLRGERGPAFKLVTPGIRLADSAADDQRRVMTPSAAIAAGSDYLVIGRPITRADEPFAVLQRINAEVAQARGAQ